MSEVKIAYLLGAGATQAELAESEPHADATFYNENGLLISQVSRRVMRRAHKTKWFREHKDIFASKQGSFNIELYISLLESNKVPEHITKKLRDLVQSDIVSILNQKRMGEFYLHKALIELHNVLKSQEKLLGIISLNYDTVIDEAFQAVCKSSPDYCLESSRGKAIPVLKLHGSLAWRSVLIYGRLEDIPIIPLGFNKNYLAPPYNFVWGKAFELLRECDILRIVGCSLSPSDFGLIDLLFKAHKQRHSAFEVQIIDFQPLNGHHQIKNNYGFLPNIVDPEEIESKLISSEKIRDAETGNPFKLWLIAKAQRSPRAKVSRTSYLSRLI